MVNLIIITGLSGSGRSVVLKALEDIGYYCIDNLPATLLPQALEHTQLSRHPHIAISVDTRNVELASLPEQLQRLKQKDFHPHVLFLDSSTEIIVQRYSETRRRHPLGSVDRSLAESIEYERELLAPLIDISLHVDTSRYSANELRQWIKDYVASAELEGITLMFTSFGFKHGIPLDSDFMFDVRCLPNPHYDKELRPQTGCDTPVQAFLQAHSSVADMKNDIQHFIAKWLPSFIQDHRSYLSVAIGCTGGQHRSVYLVEKISQHFIDAGYKVIKRHRELERQR